METRGEVVPATPSPKPSSVQMPARKSIATAAAPAAIAAPMMHTGFPSQGFQYPSMGMPQFQYGGASGMPQQGFQYAPATFGAPSVVASPPVASFMPPASAQIANIPMAQPVAIAAQPATQTTANPVELMEAQMKAMKDYIASMEKTFKEAKKGMKKPKVPKDPNAPKNPIPEGTQAWNNFVVLVQEEETARIRATDPTKGADWKGITRKEAMAKAKELKAAGDPRYNYVKKEKPATAATAAPALPAIPGAPVAAAEPKKRGRKPKAATALPAPALPPTSALPTAAFTFPAMSAALPSALPAAAEESVEVEEIVINGATYLITAKKECWHMLPNGDQGDWAGIYNGSIIVPAPEPL